MPVALSNLVRDEPPQGGSRQGQVTAAAREDRHQMRVASDTSRRESQREPLSGALLLLGFVVNAIQRTLLHPLGAAGDHEAIFAEYAASDV